MSEVLTAVSMLSTDAVFVQPASVHDKKAASQAHRNFGSRDGDLPTLVNVYLSWTKAKCDKAYAQRNYLSQRGLSHAKSVRAQLSTLLQKMGMDPSTSCYPEREPFLRCLLAGLRLNVAQRTSTALVGPNATSASASASGYKGAMGGSGAMDSSNKFSWSRQKDLKDKSDVGHIRPMFGTPLSKEAEPAPYKTVRGNQPVFVHPSSVLFGLANRDTARNGKGAKMRDSLPEYVVFGELLVTSKQYMRCVTVVNKDWLTEMFPAQFKSL
jgi:HrpA-like RNA helicase